MANTVEKSSAKTYYVYDTKEFPKLLEGLEISPYMKLKQNIEPTIAAPSCDVPISLDDLSVSDTLYCSFCNTGFVDQSSQRQHYKLDWHKYNLKMHLAQRKPVSEEQFSALADDISSISGSGTDSDPEDDCAEADTHLQKSNDDRLSHLIARKARILFTNSSGNIISLNRCLLLNRKEEVESTDYLVNLAKKLPLRLTWLVVMVGGGHFAAAIFKNGDPVLHKTFHSYTVRAKQGGSQSSKDMKGGGGGKSAGASMRRYNEQSFAQHIQETLNAWGPEIAKCDYVFYRAAGRGNTSLLFGPLQRSDPRVRPLPFTSRRPTFNEVRRLCQLVATVFVYDSDEMFRTTFSPQKAPPPEPVVPKIKTTIKPDRGKERPSPDRQLPPLVQHLAVLTSSDDSSSYILEGEIQEISFGDLKEFDDDVSESYNTVVKVKKKKKKRDKPEDEKEKMRPEVEQVWKKIHSRFEMNEVDELKEALKTSLESISKEELVLILNEKNILGETVLHKAASEAKEEVIRLLLTYGCDPCTKDKKSLTPYDHCPDKKTRNIFRRFMGEFPDMYDYSKSHIPSALTETLELEILEKRREIRKAKRLKDKEKKQQQEEVKKEEEDKKRFLTLSDREKRALAAERRLLAAGGQVATVRCFLCGHDMTGKVPFEYCGNRFCSMPCLKAHRIAALKA